MQKFAQRGDAKMEQLVASTVLNRLSWDDIRIFLTCANSSSFRVAAKALRLSSSTVGRHIDRLEQTLGISLFDRLTEGAVLTHEAEAIRESALNMEHTILDVINNRMQTDVSTRGSVTISITEGLGCFWVVPRLVDFQRHFPNITINLQCAMECADVLRLQTDLAIQFERPTSPELIVTKLGRLHVYPFAAQQYLDIFGYPKSQKDIVNHRIVQQVSSQLDEAVWARKLGLKTIDDIVGLRTNSSTSLFYAVERGAGIGALPTFATALGAPVVPIDLDDHHSLDIWLTYRSGTKKTQRKARVIEWIKSIFDPKIYPWFGDEFIHPNDLAVHLPASAKKNIGSSYFSVEPV